MSEGMDYAYLVHCQEAAEEELLDTYTKALERGEGDRITLASEAIERRLKWDPLHFGEPQYHAPDFGLVYLGVEPPLAVQFGVNEEKHVVHILRYRMLSPRGH